MTSIVPAHEFAERRKKFLNHIRHQNSIAIIPAAPEYIRNGDGHYPYRQNSDFYYLTGFNEPEAVAVFLPNHPQGEYWLFLRPNNPTMEIWNGKRVGVEGAKKELGADQAYPIEDFTSQLPLLLLNREILYVAFGKHPHLAPHMIDNLNKIRAKIRAGQSAPETMINPEKILHDMRLIKSDAEIATMRKACEISAVGHMAAMKICKPGLYEYELQAALENEFMRAGSRATAYESIVGAAANSCTLHYRDSSHLIKNNDIVLIDAGCEFENYASDITRSFPANGKFNAEQRAIYDIVLKAQLAGIEKIKPGALWPSIQETIVRIITEGLVSIGLLKGNIDELIAQKAYATFYMHNSSHWLGLDTHDVGTYKINNDWRTLIPGMVLTVEPGIYIAANTPNVPERWWNIGIRIEDDVLVTQTGYDVLSKNLPKQIDEIENLMRA